MKHFIRIVQTDSDEPEMHEDTTDVINQNVPSAVIDNIKTKLKNKMKSANYKYQRHICTHDPNGKGRGKCKLEDI